MNEPSHPVLAPVLPASSQHEIYVAMLVLARRTSPWGFGAGSFKSGFWNSVNLFASGPKAETLKLRVSLWRNWRTRSVRPCPTSLT